MGTASASPTRMALATANATGGTKAPTAPLDNLSQLVLSAVLTTAGAHVRQCSKLQTCRSLTLIASFRLKSASPNELESETRAMRATASVLTSAWPTVVKSTWMNSTQRIPSPLWETLQNSMIQRRLHSMTSSWSCNAIARSSLTSKVQTMY